MAYATISLMLVVSVRAVRDHTSFLGGREMKGTLLQQLVEDQPYVHNWVLLLHTKMSDLTNFNFRQCVQHWRTARCLGLVSGGIFLWWHQEQ